MSALIGAFIFGAMFGLCIAAGIIKSPNAPESRKAPRHIPPRISDGWGDDA